jgi:hypothetical protein
VTAAWVKRERAARVDRHDALEVVVGPLPDWQPVYETSSSACVTAGDLAAHPAAAWGPAAVSVSDVDLDRIRRLVGVVLPSRPDV